MILLRKWLRLKKCGIFVSLLIGEFCIQTLSHGCGKSIFSYENCKELIG